MIDYRPEILEYLLTPTTWLIAEALAFLVFFYNEPQKYINRNLKMYQMIYQLHLSNEKMEYQTLHTPLQIFAYSII